MHVCVCVCGGGGVHRSADIEAARDALAASKKAAADQAAALLKAQNAETATRLAEAGKTGRDSKSLSADVEVRQDALTPFHCSPLSSRTLLCCVSQKARQQQQSQISAAKRRKAREMQAHTAALASVKRQGRGRDDKGLSTDVLKAREEVKLAKQKAKADAAAALARRNAEISRRLNAARSGRAASKPKTASVGDARVAGALVSPTRPTASKPSVRTRSSPRTKATARKAGMGT